MSFTAALRRLVTRGRLLELSEGTYQRLKVRGLARETLDDVARLQPDGVATHPNEAETVDVLLLEVGGTREHVIAIQLGNEAARPAPADGERLFYGVKADGETSFVAVRCKADGSVELGADSGVAITIDPAGAVTIAGASLTLSANVVIDGKSFLAHTHPDPVSGNTGPPN